MIRLARATRLLGTEQGRWYTGWSDERMRVYVVRAQGLRMDSGTLNTIPLVWPERGQLSIQLDGALLSRRERKELVLPPAGLALESNLLWNERWVGHTFRVLVIEWSRDLGPLGTDTQVGTLSPLDHMRIATLAERIERGGRSDVASLLPSLDQILRANGVRIDGLDALHRRPEDPRDETTAALLSRLRTGLHHHPSWVDAVEASGRSERQLRRDVGQLFRRLGLTPGGLRDMLVRERLMSAIQLLSARGVSVAQVAASVGFGSARALGLALRRAGLPSASTIASLACDD